MKSARRTPPCAVTLQLPPKRAYECSVSRVGVSQNVNVLLNERACGSCCCVRAVGALRGVLHAMLDEYPTTLAEDLRTLASGSEHMA
eukprot:1801720-Pleurochrysis_carterae.AAC.1